MPDAEPTYSRALLKISGEAFCVPPEKGLNIEEIKRIASQAIDAAQHGTQLAIVVGGGNIVRGSEYEGHGIGAATADYMGMLATLINAQALMDVMEDMGQPTRVMTAIPMQAIAEPFIRRRALRHMEKGRVVILGAGTGNPHFTTDTAAALRATELQCDVLLKATKVDGVYDSDPKTNPDAKKYDKLSYLDILNQQLGVMDNTAITLCMERKLPIIVFNLKTEGNIVKAVQGETIGTLISE
jgi:uridylate kinase